MTTPVSQTTRWWWIRHAPVTSDGGRIYGQHDLPADTSDQAAFAGLAARLPDGAHWVTSNLQRTAQTADAIRHAGAAYQAPEVQPALAEQDFGDFQGEIRADVMARHGDPHGLWVIDAEMTAPGGESFGDLAARVSDVIDRINRERAGRDIVAVAHGGTIRAALGLALELPPVQAVRFATDNLSLTRIDHIAGEDGGAWRVVAVNQPPKLSV